MRVISSFQAKELPLHAMVASYQHWLNVIEKQFLRSTGLEGKSMEVLDQSYTASFLTWMSSSVCL